MYTPQRKSPWTPPTSRLTSAAKGKAVAFVDGPTPPPPPRRSIDGDAVHGGASNEDWRRFKEVGLLDEGSFDRNDRVAFLDRIATLDKELFDYQYNMGLLLLEKKDLVSKNEELGQEVAEFQEILKREQAAHLIAISEAEKREENLKKALDIEKKCLRDLERALRNTHEELAELKDTSETTVADVNSRLEALEKKRLDIEAKSHLADAKFAEINRKNSDLDRKLQDLEVREKVLQTERLSLYEEKGAHQSYFKKQKEDMLEWERKLQEGEQRLCDSRRNLKEREEKLHETERLFKGKETYIDELQKKIDSANATLEKLNDDINNRLADLEVKEKKTEAMKCDLETRENQLQEKEARLEARERVGLEKLLNEHKTLLDAKMHEHEIEMQQKRKSLKEELRCRMDEVDQKQAEINHLEAKLSKREQGLEKKLERVKEKEKDVDVKVVALKVQEKSLKAEEKKLEMEKNHVNAEKEGLEDLRREIEMWKTKLRKQELQIEEDRKELGVLEEERSNYLRLQSNLKQEMEIARRQSELIEKEAQDLKLEREKFEKDWEALDEKRSVVDKELKILAEEKATFEKLRHSEEERLKRERANGEEHLRLELESLQLQRVSFEATIEHEKLMLAEKTKDEHNLLVRDLEQQRHDLCSDMEKSQKEHDEKIEEMVRNFEEMKSREMGIFSQLKESAERKMEEMENERVRLEKERWEMESNKKQLEDTRIEMAKDIKALDEVSERLKKQREQLVSERSRFHAFVEKIKGCRNCGDSAQLFLHWDLEQPTLEGSPHFPTLSRHDQTNSKDEPALTEISKKTSPSPGAVNNDIPKLGGQMNVIRKCASIIFKSPKDRIHPSHDHTLEESPSSSVHLCANRNRESVERSSADEVNRRVQTSDAINEYRSSPGIVSNFSKKSPSVVIFREDTIATEASDSAMQDIQESEKSDSKAVQRKPRRKRGAGVRRTHSVKAVVEEAKAILGESSGEKRKEQPIDSGSADFNKPEETLAELKLPVSARKRSRAQATIVAESEQDFDHSEGNADSVTTGGRRKRQQIVPTALQTPGQKRYNLRRHTAVETATAEQASRAKSKSGDEIAQHDTDIAVEDSDDKPAKFLNVAAECGRRSELVQVSTSIEFSSDRVVRLNTTANLADNKIDGAKSVENTLLSGDAKSTGNTFLSEEVNGISENVEEDDNRSMVNENEDDADNDGSSGGGVDEDEDDDYDDHPGQASIGKKLWTFFTS